MKKYKIKLCYENLDMETVKETIEVNSIEEASIQIRSIIVNQNVFASTWYGAKVYQNEKLVGEIAYNGRFLIK